VVASAAGEQYEIGVARYVSDEFDHCESAVAVAEGWQNHNLGTFLMKALIQFARHNDKESLYSIALSSNTHMRMLARDLGMSEQRDLDDAKNLRYELKI
jgi:GNAT superfamily N-acetyltransferase